MLKLPFLFRAGIKSPPPTCRVKDFYDLHGTDLGLGFYSEQSTEAAHSDFLNSVWLQGYKVPDTHPKYRENLLNAGAKYNSRHLK